MRVALHWRVKLAVSLLAALSWFGGAHIAVAADKLPSVYFWHFLLVLDHSSYQALKDSPEIAALAGTEFRHTQTNNNSYSGFYLYGRKTFMEFFEEDPENPLGWSELGLIVEQEGALPAVAQHLKEQLGEDFKIQNTIAGAGKVPWYKSVGFDMEDEYILGSFIQETEPGYLASIHPGAQIEHPLSREVYESWRYHSGRPLKDVVAITVAIKKSAEISRLSTYLQALGWSVRPSNGGFVAAGPDIKLSVIPADSREGIREVKFTLNRVSDQTLELGHVKLTLRGTDGHLTFW